MTHTRSRAAALLAVTVAAACAAGLAAETAGAAAFDVTSFAAGTVGAANAPAVPLAGAHQDVRVQATFTAYNLFDPPPRPRSLRIDLPPGLTGNPRAVPRCPRAEFAADQCSSGTRVGAADVRAVAWGGLLPIEATGDVYSLQPAGEEPARLGVMIRAFGLVKLPIESPITLRPDDAGLSASIEDLPTTAPVAGEIWLERIGLTLLGTPAGASAPFLTTPTSCIPARSVLTATSYGIPAAQRTAAAVLTPQDCAAVPFTPGVTAEADPPEPGVPAAVTASLTLPGDAAVRAQSHVQRAEVVLPDGIALSPAVANGLTTCTDGELGPPADPAACPAAAQIGTVAFDTPLLGVLGGRVFLGAAAPADPYRLFVAVDERGVRLKLRGSVRLDPDTGRITTVFNDLPQVPFTRFSLAFRGGSRAVLSTPRTCGARTVTARLMPWRAAPSFASGADVRIEGTLAIGGDACAAATPFRPTLAVSASNTAAGGDPGALSVAVARPDGDQLIRRLTIDLPPGLLGRIVSVPACPEADVAAAACGDASRVGVVRATVGPGPEPVALDGTVHATGPSGRGLAGLAIVLPARVGPFDLGTVVVRAGISVRADGGLTVTTDPLPEIVGGVPIAIRTLALSLDRPGFLLNPTSCSALTVHAVLDGDGGATAEPSAPFQAAGCGRLPFRPVVTAALSGTLAAGGKPALRAVITVPPGHAAVRRAAVTLPRQVRIALGSLATACTSSQFAAGRCPARSRLGSAVAMTSLLPAPLAGPVHLVERPGGGLPTLGVDLRGLIRLPLVGDIALPPSGQVTTTFAGIPDVPLERFDLVLDGGPGGALAAVESLCRGPAPEIAGAFTAHSGARAPSRRVAATPGCSSRPVAAAVLRGAGTSRPRLALRIVAARRAPDLRSVTVVLPPTIRGVPAATRTRVTVRAGDRRLARGVRLGTRRLTVTGLPRGTRSVTVSMDRGALASRRARLGSGTSRFSLRIGDAGGRVSRVTVRARPRR